MAFTTVPYFQSKSLQFEIIGFNFTSFSNIDYLYDDVIAGDSLEYALVRKTAKMIGSLYLLNRQCPTVKQRTTAVLHENKLILYNNGKNPKSPRLIIDLNESTNIIGGIEANCRFILIDSNQSKHEFEALDEDERDEWVSELEKCREFSDNGIELEDQNIEDSFNDMEDYSIYEEVGPMLIYDVPKCLETTPVNGGSEANNHNSLTPPPPLPLRTMTSRSYDPTADDADFPPPPAFEDAGLSTVIFVPPPPPPPKPVPPPQPPVMKMIPPPPPPNSNKIQIFSKSPLKAFKAATSGRSSNSASNSSLDKTDKTSPKKKENFGFDEELRQKINAKKTSCPSFDENMLMHHHNRPSKIFGGQSPPEAELEAILKKRREKLQCQNPDSNRGPPSRIERKSSFHHLQNFSVKSQDDEKLMRKTSSFRVKLGSGLSEPGGSKFNTLPHRFNSAKTASKTTASTSMASMASNKPRVPDKKPAVFAREHSLKLQTWNRISAGNKCI